MFETKKENRFTLLNKTIMRITRTAPIYSDYLENKKSKYKGIAREIRKDVEKQITFINMTSLKQWDKEMLIESVLNIINGREL